MKSIYLKYKILVNGLCTKTNYSIDGFTLKRSKFDIKIFKHKYDVNKKGIDFNLNLYLMNCINNELELSYNYLETDNFEEIKISNKQKINSQTITEILINKKEIIYKIYNLEQKIRLSLNIPLIFQIVCIEFYDESKKFLEAIQINKSFSNWNRLIYDISNDEFSNNSRYRFNFNDMKNTNNNHFNRALEFYNDSFESEKISNRFILIFSSLEAIFNLESSQVTEKISRYTAKILANGNEKEYEKVYSNIKKLYKKRCRYIHGSENNNILIEDEILLRYYVRKIIINYWIIIITTKKTAKEILNYLNSGEKLDLQVRLVISSLNSSNFTEQQHKIINIIENELGIEVPIQTKNAIYKKCDKNVN